MKDVNKKGRQQTVQHEEDVIIDQLRPHHILCDRFLDLSITSREGAFERVASAIQELLSSDSEDVIEVIEGVDILCLSCPECREGRCESPNGSEEEVRKWDGKVLKGLGLSYGDKMSAKAFRSIVEEKAPLEFCRSRCPWRGVCRVFDLR